MPHALKGRHKGHGLVAPFQGLITGGSSRPRALPWADLWLPLRGGGPNSQHQKAQARVTATLACASG